MVEAIRILSRYCRRRRAREHGQALVLFAAGLAGFCGLVGMSVDIGHVASEKAGLQRTADAAALAGAQDLAQGTPNTSAATASATSYLQTNLGNPAAGSYTASITFPAPDTIEVTVSRPVDYTFLRVIGLNGANPSATARVKVKPVTGYEFEDEDDGDDDDWDGDDIFPYTVWGGQRTTPANSCPYNICTGSTQVFRANNFQASSNATGADWSVNGNNFKGFFHHGTGITEIDPYTWQTFSSGGNAIGQEPVSKLQAHMASGEPIIVPVVQQADCTGGCGAIKFKIVAWVALKITSVGNPSQPWTGVVVDNALTSGKKGSTTGPYAPPSGFPAPRTVTLLP
jgi:Flp pilus assembly protein TadG